MYLKTATTKSTNSYWDSRKTGHSLKQAAAMMKRADAVVIGAGAGLSASAGFTYSGKRFHDNFADFIEILSVIAPLIPFVVINVVNNPNTTPIITSPALLKNFVNLFNFMSFEMKPTIDKAIVAIKHGKTILLIILVTPTDSTVIIGL